MRREPDERALALDGSRGVGDGGSLTPLQQFHPAGAGVFQGGRPEVTPYEQIQPGGVAVCEGGRPEVTPDEG